MIFKNISWIPFLNDQLSVIAVRDPVQISAGLSFHIFQFFSDTCKSVVLVHLRIIITETFKLKQHKIE